MIMPLPDELWSEIEDLLPLPAEVHAGRLSDRRAVEGILFVLRARIGWNALPASLAYGSAATLYRRLQYWQSCGAWPAVEAVLRERLPDGHSLDWARLRHQAPGPSMIARHLRAVTPRLSVVER